MTAGTVLDSNSLELGNRVIESWYNLRRLHSSLGYRSPPNTRPHWQPDQHTKRVRQSGTSSP